MEIKGDQNVDVNYYDPGEKSSESDIMNVLKFYRRGDYFLTGSVTTDVSQGTYKQRLVEDKKKSAFYLQGALMGVFFPVLNNIFGALLYIRQPELVGEIGIGLFLLIVLLCCMATFSTSLSLSALVSNGRIRHGGTYFVLSRSLGAPLGTAMGFCYFIGANINAANFILSMGETYLKMGGSKIVDADFVSNMRIYGICIWAVLLIINLIGLKYVSSAGLIFMAGVIFSIIGGMVGIGIRSDEDPILADDGRQGWNGLKQSTCNDNWGPSPNGRSFITAMGIFFPAVTGILAGANRSGEIEKQATMIPAGTLAAQIFSSLTYILLTVFYGCGADYQTLTLKDTVTFAEVTWPNRYLCAVGIVCSAAGSAIENMAGAPRLLLGMYEDGNLPILSRFKGRFQLMVIINSFLILGFTMIGSIDAVTPLISMFVLVPYVALNLLIFLYETIQFPNWRPTFKYYNRWFSLVGAILSFILMCVIGQYYILVAFAVILIVYLYVKHHADKDPERNNYGDVSDAMKLKFANLSIRNLMSSQKHVKNWVPSYLVLTDISSNGVIHPQGALQLMSQLFGDACLTIVGHVHESQFQFKDFEEAKKKQNQLEQFFKENGYKFLTKVIQSENLIQGTKFLIQGTGLAGLEPNVIVLGFPEKYREKPEIAQQFLESIQQSILLGKAIMVTKSDESFTNKELVYRGNVDIFCFSYEKGLMILMAYLLKRTKQWQNAKIRLFIITMEQQEKEEQRLKEEINGFISRYRMFTSIEVNSIILKPFEFENFLLQEYKKYLIGQKNSLIRSNILNQLALEEPNDELELKQIAKKLSANIEKQSENQQPQDQTQIEVQDRQVLNINPTVNNSDPLQADKMDFKAPEKFLSSVHSKGDNLNKLLKLHSQNSDLIILNLPAPIAQDPIQYLDYLRVMTSGLKRILFIKNESQEVITEYT